VVEAVGDTQGVRVGEPRAAAQNARGINVCEAIICKRYRDTRPLRIILWAYFIVS